MGIVPAPKKTLTAEMAAELTAARERVTQAETAMWRLCAHALEQATYDEVASVVGYARSTLQEKVRQYRS